jgi:hypothetical protein
VGRCQIAQRRRRGPNNESLHRSSSPGNDEVEALMRAATEAARPGEGAVGVGTGGEGQGEDEAGRVGDREIDRGNAGIADPEGQLLRPRS